MKRVSLSAVSCPSNPAPRRHAPATEPADPAGADAAARPPATDQADAARADRPAPVRRDRTDAAGPWAQARRLSPAAFFLLPMLPGSPRDLPGFRDCYTRDPDRPELGDGIHLYLRVGGARRARFAGQIAALRARPGYQADWDDPLDGRYATFAFAPPARWADDFRAIVTGQLGRLTQAYLARLREVFPRPQYDFDWLLELVGESREA